MKVQNFFVYSDENKRIKVCTGTILVYLAGRRAGYVMSSQWDSCMKF